MRLIRHFVAVLLGLAIGLTAISYVLNGTLFSSAYWLNRADTANIYPQVAAKLPDIVAEFAPLGQLERTVVTQLFDTDYVHDHTSQILPQMERHYKSDGAIPSIDLTPLGDAADAVGYRLTPALAKLIDDPIPVSFGPADEVIRTAYGLSGLFGYLGPISVLILLGLVVVIGGRRRGLLVAQACVIGAVVTAAGAGLVQLLPRSITTTALTSAANPLAEPLSTWLKAGVVMPIQNLLYIGAGLLVAAVVFVVIHFVAGAAARFRRHPKGD